MTRDVFRGILIYYYEKIFNGYSSAETLKALEKIAIDLPEVCIMNPVISGGIDQVGPAGTFGDLHLDSIAGIQEYFSGVGDITEERCDTIISKSGEALGEYDFFFEWFIEPKLEQLNDLIEKIDETLEPLGCKYTITTK